MEEWKRGCRAGKANEGRIHTDRKNEKGGSSYREVEIAVPIVHQTFELMTANLRRRRIRGTEELLSVDR